MARRELLQLADRYDPRKHDVAGWFISEKLDGTRCFWDGGITRGLPTEQVPWASVIDPKTGEKKGKIKPVATGLWSRYGNPIMAPDWWLNKLPPCPLDGELWAGRGEFQLCRSICGGDEPDPRFNTIVFAVYSSPPLSAIFATGQIKNANMVAAIDFMSVEHWVRGRLEALDGSRRQDGGHRCLPPGAAFADELTFTRKYLTGDHLWYFPPPDVFRRLVEFANANGNPPGRPYFSLDGKTSLAASQWEQFRGKFYCDAGVTNVWHVPAVRGKERIKVRGDAVHPNQKPLALMRRLVKSCSDPGDVVWEPFGGLCTASIAAAEIGRRAVAAEIRAAIYERALQRIEQAA